MQAHLSTMIDILHLTSQHQLLSHMLLHTLKGKAIMEDGSGAGLRDAGV